VQGQVNATPASKRVPWNKGKLTGAKPPLRPKHVWSIRTKLQIEGRTRDLAMFNLAIDSKLRGCTSLPSGSRMLLPAGTQRIAQLSGKRKTSGLSDLFHGRLIRQDGCPNYIKFRMTLNRIKNRDLSWHTSWHAREMRHG
jgi:hypothetical protein